MTNPHDWREVPPNAAASTESIDATESPTSSESPASSEANDAIENGSDGVQRFVKPIVLVILVVVALVLLQRFGQYVRLDYLATKEGQLRTFQNNHPTLVYGVAFLVYVVVTGLSLPGAAGLTLVYGWYFGWMPSLLLVSFASTMGATVAFMTSRYLLRGTIQSKFGGRLASFNHRLEQEGAFYLFTLRLIPLVPFFVINLVMGLTPLKARTFWWISQVGMFPGTMVYTYAGSRVPNLTELAEKGAAAVFSPSQLIQIAVAFGLLGIFPLATKHLLSYFTSAPTSEDP